MASKRRLQLVDRNPRKDSNVRFHPLGAGLDANEGGSILTASRKIDRVQHLGEVMRKPALLIAGRKLTAACRKQGAKSLTNAV
jgi:hypothetical protein